MAAVGEKRTREDEEQALIVLRGGRSQQGAIIKQWQQRKLCDAEIIAGSSTFYAHRSVLAANSEYFDGLYCSTAGEAMGGGEGAHTVADVSAPVFEAVLSFIYQGKCTLLSPTHA